MFSHVTFSAFCDAFRAHDRQGQFSYHGKRALFDFLEDYEDQTGQAVEFDVVGLCCDYVEMTTDEVLDCYTVGLDVDDEDDVDEAVTEWLSQATMLVSSYRVNGEAYHLFAQF
jgi:hypothetical protein